MAKEQRPLEPEELEAQNGELLPDREEMMLIDPSGEALLGPPDLAGTSTPPELSDPNQ